MVLLILSILTLVGVLIAIHQPESYRFYASTSIVNAE